MLIMVVKVMMLFATPSISFSMGVVIWVGLAALGVKGQDKARHKDKAQPSLQVHSLTLRKNFGKQDLLIRKQSAGKC